MSPLGTFCFRVQLGTGSANPSQGCYLRPVVLQEALPTLLSEQTSKNIPNVTSTMRVSTQFGSHCGKTSDFLRKQLCKCKDIPLSALLEELSTEVKNSREVPLPLRNHLKAHRHQQKGIKKLICLNNDVIIELKLKEN